ncbi:hypothetical protein Goshw_026134 [Gossypium schwendimanii]|uniref:RING-type domain-containing protein n=1 Tax=Gossypium schwendimanii TaxID=34291 RepID=A0A7J9LRG8_GOSSC|nr:hypothetical protein [Gossypium schwendimanii]
MESRITKWKNLKQRLGLKAMGMGCCGATWNPRPRISTISILDEDEETPQSQQVITRTTTRFNVVNSATVPLLLARHHHQQQQAVPTPTTSASGMNLAMALAAERNLRGTNDNTNNVGPRPVQVKTLMRLIEETEGEDCWTQQEEQQKKKQRKEVVENEGGGGGSCDWMCCVCMERKKGAAFIPCGHAFCRVCSREVCLNRGSCPVCNRSILDILDIF